MYANDDTTKNVEVNKIDEEKNELIVTTGNEVDETPSCDDDKKTTQAERKTEIINLYSELGKLSGIVCFVKYFLKYKRGVYKDCDKMMAHAIQKSLKGYGISSKSNKADVLDALQTELILLDQSDNKPEVNHGDNKVAWAVDYLLSSDVVSQLPYYRGDNPILKNAKYVINLKNTLLALSLDQNGEVVIDQVPHTPDWISNYQLPYNYDPDATYELLMDTWKSTYNDPENLDPNNIDPTTGKGYDYRISVQQEFNGLCLTTDTSLQVALYKWGAAASGKGLGDHITKHLVGVENCATITPQDLADKFIWKQLINKAVVFIPEMHSMVSKGVLTNSTTRQNLTATIGEGEMPIQGKGKDISHFQKLPCKFILSSNTYVKDNDESDGWSRRMKGILHDTPISSEKRDHTLYDRIVAPDQLPGILNWALAGLVRLMKNGGKMTTCPLSEREMRRHKLDVHPILKWADEECSVTSEIKKTYSAFRHCTVDDDAKIDSMDAYSAYTRWCAENGEIALDQRIFGRKLHEYAQKIVKKKVRRGEGYANVYIGIGLRKPVTTIDEKSIENVIPAVTMPAIDGQVSQAELDEIDSFPHPGDVRSAL